VNKAKSSIFFSPNSQQPARLEVRDALNIDREALSEKYLWLPTASGRITEEVFEHILERTRGKAHGWCEKLMSSAAKEVLIKSILQALPLRYELLQAHKRFVQKINGSDV
jgi:hypothetical protein